MRHDPEFYLTAAGEYPPLAEPRDCSVKYSLRDNFGNDYLVVDIRPAFEPTDFAVTQVSTVLLSARHRRESIAHITSWPFFVYVSHMLDDNDVQSFEPNQLRLITWARLYPSIEAAAQDAKQHAAALRSTQAPQKINVEELQFVGEQDGPPERVLKEGLVRLFVDDERIWKAYLAKAEYAPAKGTHVILCLRTSMGPDNSFVAKVLDVFASLFRTSEILDILFINNQQEHDLARVCKPFYVRTIERDV